MKDRYSRNINYLRVSLTDKCNLRCSYCMPEEKEQCLNGDRLLTDDEIYRIIRILTSSGIEKVRFTGGEPLMRKNAFSLFRAVRQLEGLRTMSLTTNGTLVPLYEKELRESGFDQINVSIDTLSRKEYADITRTDGSLLDSVRKSLDILSLMDIMVKINCVPIKGLNEDAIPFLAEIAREQPIDVRFIEFMPLGCEKGLSGIGSDQITGMLEKRFGKVKKVIGTIGEPAVYFRFRGFKGRIGVISPLSHKFCRDCSRIRLTPDGIIRPCLFHDDGADIRVAIRNGATDKDIADILRTVVMNKPYEHFFNEAPRESSKRNMNMIGG